jgi:hypothetical protein
VRGEVKGGGLAAIYAKSSGRVHSCSRVRDQLFGLRLGSSSAPQVHSFARTTALDYRFALKLGTKATPALSKDPVRRIRWFEPDKDDPSGPIAWSAASLVTATLFLNWSFTAQSGGLWLFCPLPLYAMLLGIFALLLTGLFFIGPASATRAAGRPLFPVVEDSLGSIPACGPH